jgi:hypothetical protein
LREALQESKDLDAQIIDRDKIISQLEAILRDGKGERFRDVQ